jgi:hypothetical protein
MVRSPWNRRSTPKYGILITISLSPGRLDETCFHAPNPEMSAVSRTSAISVCSLARPGCQRMSWMYRVTSLARGEIDREEYMQTTHDLGGEPIPED